MIRIKTAAKVLLFMFIASVCHANTRSNIPSVISPSPTLNPLFLEKATPSVADTSKVVDLDEVVIVSQPKESYRLRQQPVSSSVLTGNELTALRIDDVRGLSAYVPSFVMPEYGSRITSAVYVRGIGSRINNPAVGMYLDGMPLLSKSVFNVHTYQIDRMDVLRGPQGTLYGQNTEGGLVRIYSKNPMEYQGTDIKFGIGTYMRRNVELAHFHRPSDKLAFSVSMFYDGTNGFLKNSYTGDKADKSNEAGGKVRLIYKPSDRVTLDLITDYQYVRQGGFAYGPLNLDNGRAGMPETNREGNYRRNILNTGLNLNVRGNSFDFNSMTTWQYLKDYMLMDNDYTSKDYMWLEERQFQNAVAQEFTFKGTKSGLWHWTAGLYGSHQWLKTNAPVFFGQDMTQPMSVGIQRSMYSAIVNAMAQKMIAGGMPESVAMAMAEKTVEEAGGVSLGIDMRVPGLFRTPQMNLGLFHESNIVLGKRLTVTLGLRYDFNRVKIEYDTKALMTMAANVMGREAVYSLASHLLHETDDNYNQLLPKFGLTYKLNSNFGNVYATVTKGFRAGGFNIQMFSDILQSELMANRNNAMNGDYEVPHNDEDHANIDNTISYKPEESWNFETGTHLNLFSGSVHADFAAYYMMVRNQQLSVMAGDYGFGRMMVNAGRSNSYGIEAALRGKALGNRLSWSASYAYTHAEFKDYSDRIGEGGINNMPSVDLLTDDNDVPSDYSGKLIPFVPVHTLAATADYTIPFTRGKLTALTFGANLTAMGRVYWDEANTYSQPFYAVAGAHADATFSKITLSLWADNLTATRYNTFAMDASATGAKLHIAQRGTPFMAGVEVRMHF